MDKTEFETGLMKKSKSFLIDFLRRVINRMNDLEDEVKTLKKSKQNKPKTLKQ